MELEAKINQKLKKPLSYSKGHKVFMYLMSSLLAPFGLVWAFKYLKEGTVAGKKVGITIVLITFISIISVLLMYSQLLEVYNKLLDFDSQTYKDLGF